MQAAIQREMEWLYYCHSKRLQETKKILHNDKRFNLARICTNYRHICMSQQNPKIYDTKNDRLEGRNSFAKIVVEFNTCFSIIDRSEK